MFFLILGFFASTVGALSGIGGGIIVKPVLDALTSFSSSATSFLSASCVFTMAAASAARHLLTHTRFQACAFWLGAGAVLGGFAGAELFDFALAAIGSDVLVKLLQNILLLLLLAVILCYINTSSPRQFHMNNRAFILLVGTLLGTVSAFLGIGGGPINVAALCLLFSMDLKNATANSMVLILFSQASKLLTVFMTGSVPTELDPTIFLWLLPSAVAGGIIGTALNRKVDKKTLRFAYNGVMLFVMCTCLFNVLQLIP